MPAPKGHPPYPGCETGGRPKIYNDEFIEKEADLLEEWTTSYKDSINMFIEDFAFERGYSYRRIAEWKDQNEKFAHAYERFFQKQKTLLIKGSLSGKLKHNMCALILGNSHGIYAKTEQKITGSSEEPLEFLLNDMNPSKELVNDSK